MVAAALTAPAAAVDDVASVDDNMNRVFTSHPASPSMLFINEAVGSSRVSTLPGKNKLYELLLYPAKKVQSTASCSSLLILSDDSQSAQFSCIWFSAFFLFADLEFSELYRETMLV